MGLTTWLTTWHNFNWLLCELLVMSVSCVIGISDQLGAIILVVRDVLNKNNPVGRFAGGCGMRLRGSSGGASRVRTQT